MTLTREEARRFYDGFGARQDAQHFYEDPAIADLVANSGFEEAQRIFEFGCGTGRFAADLLGNVAPSTAIYRGVDISQTMLALTSERLAPFSDRATAAQTDGAAQIIEEDASFDRFVSNYVLDILPPDQITEVIAEAHRILSPRGKLCLISLTRGRKGLSKLVTAVWSAIHSARPITVGGCRPLELKNFVDERDWDVEHCAVIVAWGVPSEVLVASRREQRQQ